MKHVYIKNNVAFEIIPESNDAFPNVPLQNRYSAEFLSHVVTAPDDVALGQPYDPATGTFGPTSTPTFDDKIVSTSAELDAAYRSGVNSYE